ncbi:MAG TPA: hypothetical protein VF510_21665 [Ktedonobacterales bacterium]
MKPFFSFVSRLPLHFYLGILLNLFAWTSGWMHLGFWSPYVFFPLWFGFILALDGLNVARSGTSPLRRSVPRFVAMFAISALLWWAFEGLNVPVQNWHYHMDHVYAPLEYIFWTTLDFSTVLPAVMEIAELLASVALLRPRLAADDMGPRLTYRTAWVLVGVGVVALALPFIVPHYAFGLVWLCLIFLLDPINNLARRKSAVGHLLAGDWRFIVTLPLAALVCGFFWEMWNSHMLPGWYYTVPFLNAEPKLLPLRLFEMPVLGYLGYLPFGIELFAMYQFVLLICGRRKDNLIF